MPAPIASLLDPAQLAGALLSLPLVSLLLAAIIAVGISLSPRWAARRRSRVRLTPTSAAAVSARYAPEHVALGIAAIAVIVIFAAENLITGYVLDLFGVSLNGVVSWWRYATPVFTASVGVAVLLALIATRGSTPPEQPVVAARRTWLTFSSLAAGVGTALALLALTATTLLAGLASSNLDDGPYVYLEIDVPNETIDPIRPWFYGWAYGVPVLICTAALVAVVVATLRANAARAFLRPETVVAEQRERRDVARGITRLTASAALLALAGALRFIAEAGSVAGLTVEGDGRSATYDAVWRYGEIAAVGGWLAPALEVTAFVLLLLVTAQLAHVSEHAAAVRRPVDARAAR
ncbi:hypothetical protein [Microbacterium sp. Se5.02b]|uniref:hypothetical protein n=1 Tax=Microbacterium sp. Se5.02b TaxID=2864103 RepID=UPI001C68A272|nr:hypothetical protein [Microbacterium sp. Se5.02b]QYM64048.1 hypothetical protein K1X59_18440 [Microbacterium sp. Se5.02b]